MSDKSAGKPSDAFWGIVALCFWGYVGYHYYSYGTLPFDAQKWFTSLWSAATTTEVSPRKQVPPGAPVLQAELLRVVEAARDTYSSAQNDMAKGAARPMRARAICDLLRGRFRVEGWVGTIANLSTNSEGRGVLAIDIGQETQVKTWNNALSDIGSDTFLDPHGDVLVHCDRSRKRALLDVILTVSRSRQVILLTQEREVLQWAQENVVSPNRLVELLGPSIA